MTVASRSLFSSLSRSLGCMMTALSISPAISADVWQEVEHGFVDNDGVKIHYAAMGDGPLVVMIHGFPDFWYSWRHQMDGLKGNYPWSQSISEAITKATNQQAMKTTQCPGWSPILQP